MFWNMTVITAGLALGSLSVSGLSQAAADQPSRHALTKAVNEYLADHGDLCVGKFTWPRDVTPADLAAQTNDAVQLPVLERLGLVASAELLSPAAKTPASWQPAAGDQQTDASGKRYSLTEKGRRYYLQKRHVTLGAHDRPAVHDADLCVARLSLDQVVKWSPPEQVNGHLQTLVRYTYHVKPAPWMADPQARQVFPVADRIIRNENHLLMSVTVRLEHGRWRPVLPSM